MSNTEKNESPVITLLQECPQGAVDGTCTTADCYFQQGKWKGTILPDVTLRNEDGVIELVCDSMEVNHE